MSVTWVVSGKMANLDAKRGPQVAVDLAALQAKRFRDVIEPHAVGIAVNEKHRRFGGLELVGAEVVRLQIDRDDALDEARKFVRRRAESFVVGFDRRAFECFGGEVRECVQPFFCPTVLAEHGRNADDLAHLVRMADRAIQRHAAAGLFTFMPPT